ncbi:MAG: hypothetical protein DRP57_10890 [Spirochaetes bacterium]|nr:MAG: hypothetical protein DRP57_10890 [Spirochaetota bacterium]
MEKKLKSFKEHIISTLREVENDLKKNQREWEESKGVFKNKGYVYKENINVFKNELKSIAKTREIIEGIDISKYNNVKDFKATIISKLEDLYDQSILMRSGINLVMRNIYRVDEKSLPDIILE